MSFVNNSIPKGFLILMVYFSIGVAIFTMPYKINSITTRAMNVWIKFIPFVNSIWKKNVGVFS